MPRTAAAILLGLTAVAVPIGAASGCGSDVESQGNGGAGGVGGMGVDSSMAAAYGVVTSVGSGGMGGMESSTNSGSAAYGVPQTDADMDGYIDQQVGGDDCDDMDANVHPGAPDKPGDGKDSNCDGSDDT
jgi:hypothetical protein